MVDVRPSKYVNRFQYIYASSKWPSFCTADIFKSLINNYIFIKISLTSDPNDPINTIPAMGSDGGGWASIRWRAIIWCSDDHDDVIKWKQLPRYWPFVRGIHQSPVNSPHKGQWRGALKFSLICAWINGWVNNGEAGDLRHCRAHYDVTLMIQFTDA